MDFAAAQFADPRVARWHWPADLGGPRTREQTAEILERQASQCRSEGFGFWWWRERDSGRLVRMAGLNRVEIEGEPMIEVGWSISPSRWREGLATEAAGAVLDWGQGVAGLDSIVAYTLPENDASRRVMEKLGMRYERDFEHKGFPQVLYRADRSLI